MRNNTERPEVIEQLAATSGAYGSDKYFGKGELMHQEPVGGVLFEQHGGTLVMAVTRVDESDDDVSVEDNHAGQSSRRVAR